MRSVFVLCLAVAFLGFSANVVEAAYDADIAYDLTLYSAISYCGSDIWNGAWTCPYCTRLPNFNITRIIDDGATTTFAYGGVDHKHRFSVISYQGTTDWEGWVYNLQFAKLEPYEDHPEAKVHSGFYKLYRTIQTQTHAVFEQLQALYPDYPVYFTGHSQGAALATLASLDIARSYPGVRPIMYNQGCPRVGNKAFARLVDQAVTNYRLTHFSDIVVHLPYEWMGFLHSVQEIWYPNANGLEYKVCSPTNPEDPDCADSISVPLGISAHTHYMDIYMSGGC